MAPLERENIAPPGRPGVVVPPPKRDRRLGIALCLSGGGFRAALFHLGALRRLHEVGLLQQVRTISSVSGGSILAGYLAETMIRAGMMTGGMRFPSWEDDVASGFRAIAGRDLRTWPVLAHVLWNWMLPGPRVRHMAARMRRRITASTLGSLPIEPHFIFCATNLTYGVNWEFTRDKTGDYVGGHLKAEKWELALAMAASASFPPLFGPLTLHFDPRQRVGGKYSGLDRDVLASKAELTDGGVYDNLALEPAWKEHEYVFVSDCGAPFQLAHSRHYLRRLLRYISVVMNQAAAMRKRAFFADISENDPLIPPRYQGAYWGIGGSVERYASEASGVRGYSQALVDGIIERIRTDLDRFTLHEMHVLENHGYLLAAAVLERRRPELIASGSPSCQAPHACCLDESTVRSALSMSHKRVSIRRMLRLDPPH